MKNRVRSVNVVVAIVVGVAVGGCQRDDEIVRQQLAARQAEWARDVGVLRQAVAEARASLDAIPRASGGPGADVGRRGLEAVVDGDRQALVDVQNQTRQIGTRIEEAIGAGGDARRMLDEESARIAGYLQAMRQRIPEAAQGIASLTRAREPHGTRN